MRQKRRYRRDHEGAMRLIVVVDGIEGFEVRFTRDCTGCTDYGDYGTKYGPSGCSECGYTGKRRERWWVPFGMEAA